MCENNGIPLFTICIPTFNRGNKALNLVKSLIDEVSDDWEILVLNNNSSREREAYEEIKLLAQATPVLRYFVQEINVQFQGNFLSCFERSRSDHFMVISDEDFVNVEVLKHVVVDVLSDDRIGVFRGSIQPHKSLLGGGINSMEYPENRYLKGKDALCNFSFYNNYPHGTIYNGRLAREKGLVDMLRDNLLKQRTYPHIYMDMLISSVGDVVTSSRVCTFEGEGQDLNKDNNQIVGSAYSFGGRVDQLITLRDAVFDVVYLVDDSFDEELFVLLFLKLCDKYFYLISRVNMREFVSNYGLNPIYVQKSFYYTCCAAISVDVRCQNIAPLLIGKLDEMKEKWEKILSDDINRING